MGKSNHISPRLSELGFFLIYRQWCLSETVKDMRAYLWVTDDILNQIRTLNPDGNDKIKKAQEIVDRIYRRDFYKVIGEKRVKWRDEFKSLPVQCSYCN